MLSSVRGTLSQSAILRLQRHTCPWLASSYVHGMPRLILFCAAVVYLLLLSYQFSMAEEPVSTEASLTGPKLYSPFDEPKPKIPDQMLTDTRLDRKVTVCVKSMNMQDIFAQIRKQTGVRIVVAKELKGERPIIFYRDKPLRDLMAEISALYGYYWLAKGQKESWTYELFEDMVHEKRRDHVRESQQAAQVESLLDCIEMCSKALESDAAREQLCRTHPRLCSSVEDPSRRELLKLITLMDRSTIRSLMNDVGKALSYTDLSPQMQSAVLETINTRQGKRGGQISEPWTAEQMHSAIVVFKWFKAGTFVPPHFCLVVAIPATGEGSTGKRISSEWPYYAEGEPDLLSLPETPPGRVIGDPLPSDVKITVKRTRKQLYGGSILLGDVLAAIAEQANLDIVADYYLQSTSLSACSDKPLDKLVSEVCRWMDYTCQVEINMLCFRYNKWFLQPLLDEPPKSLQEHLWKSVIEKGGLSLDDLLDIACLPGNQTQWEGFELIPQASRGRRMPRTGRIVRMLGSELENEACTPAGLPVSKLNAAQFSRIVDWAGVMGIKETPEDLLRCTIRIEKIGVPVNSLKFILVLLDGRPRMVQLSAQLDRLDEKERRTIAEERAADLASDRIEVSVSSSK